MKNLSLQAPTALAYFATLVADDASFALLEAAIVVAQDDHPQLDAQAVLAEIDGLAARLKRRVPADASAMQRLRSLNHYFFEELGFAGNVNDYYDRRNSYLSEVLATRRGIPITLALLYTELATQLGLVARGVSFPGHFLIKLRMPQGEVVIDPFSGRSLSREDLDERLAPYRKRHGLHGDYETPLGLFLQAAEPREVLSRLLRNLKEIHRSAGDWPRLLAVLQRLVVLLPEAAEERRDRGLAWAELGHPGEAVADLEVYLSQRPDADDAALLRQRVSELRRFGAPRLH
ncbi:SirB1 family protein [Aquabacterium sp.]|uniref:SirB1 family protein n=1 Tax=Aquabacterium sp. TaxID=1872578 RepID=UPI002CBA575A|nr:tetratricopeptide repeat protein [Aquabacterium sp.]HSW02975.1 tetratricopeptide repeat protein [Aquabacterium sp.]